MIRRDIRLAEGAAGWMLISQVEHARISAHLASHCRGPFGPPGARGDRDDSPDLDAVRTEVLDAIALHDDGWADWERAPRLDAKLGRPLSFMELETNESLAIWSRSIESAAARGPLAAWMVAGHFSWLLGHSESSRGEASALAWRDEMSRRRENWFTAWRAIDPNLRTRDLADAALQWLWTFDVASLWFCNSAAAGDEAAAAATQFNTTGEGTPLEMRFRSRPAAQGAAATAMPWRFDAAHLAVEADGLIVPAMCYANPYAMFAAGEPHRLHWRFER